MDWFLYNGLHHERVKSSAFLFLLSSDAPCVLLHTCIHNWLKASYMSLYVAAVDAESVCRSLMYRPWIRSSFQRQLSSLHRFRFACFLLRLLQSCLPDFHSLLEQQLHFSVVLYLSTFVPVNQLKMLTFKMSALPYEYFSVRVLPLYILKFNIQPSCM